MHFFAAFLLAYAFSGLAIVENQRLITFFWDFYIYICFFFLVYMVYAGAESTDAITRLITRILLFSAACQLIASTYFIFGDWSYTTPVNGLLPESVKETAIGKSIAIRSVGKEAWLLGLPDRLESVFSSSIHFGSFLFLTVPLVVYQITTGSMKNKLVAWLLAISTVVFLVLSQSRTAIALALIMFPLLLLSVRLAKSPAFDPGMFTAMLVLVLCVLLTLGVASYAILETTFTDVFVESRATSFEQRYGVYTQSLERLTDRPLFGHGTQVDVENIRIPLGSHNWFLAVLFKHGLVGFIPFILFMASVFWRGFTSMFATGAAGNERALLVSLLIGYPFFLVLCLTIEPTVDVLDVIGAAAYIGMFLATGRIVERSSRLRQKRIRTIREGAHARVHLSS